MMRDAWWLDVEPEMAADIRHFQRPLPLLPHLRRWWFDENARWTAEEWLVALGVMLTAEQWGLYNFRNLLSIWQAYPGMGQARHGYLPCICNRYRRHHDAAYANCWKHPSHV